MKRITYILLFALLPFASSANDSVPAAEGNKFEITKEGGDKAYTANQFADAVKIYEETIEKSGATMQLYYNLGNAYFRLGNKGKAILNYERALKLDPTDEDAKKNLDYLNTLTEDEVLPEPEIFFVSWWNSLVNLAGVDAWAIAAVVFFIVLLTGSALFFLSKNSAVRKAGLVAGSVSLLLTVIANLAALSMYNRVTDDSKAIVVKEEVSLMNAPGASTVLIKVHEGRKVTIIDDTIDQWTEIELEDGTVGWVKKESIERI